MPFLEALGLSALAVLGCMTTLWILSLIIKDSSIVDIFWGVGFIVITGPTFALSGGFAGRKLLVLILVVIWGLRLAIHIARRNIGMGEDKRYQAFRKRGGANYWWISFFQVFALQGILMLLISVPLIASQVSAEATQITLLDVLGSSLWLVGFSFESIGDFQLARFKADPANKGKIMNAGLWRYTRHPNYFGECVLWWGYFIIALSTPIGVWTVMSPLVMTFLLVRVSGVAILERSMANRGPEYKAYLETTSAFIPMPPRRSQSGD